VFWNYWPTKLIHFFMLEPMQSVSDTLYTLFNGVRQVADVTHSSEYWAHIAASIVLTVSLLRTA